MDEFGHAPAGIDPTIPNIARMYDYYLGGKDNFPADRQAAEQTLKAFPNARIAARANRAFLHRSTRYLAAEAGIRQFLVRRYLDALPAGSYLALSHGTPDFAPEECARTAEIYRQQGIQGMARTRAEVERFFDGLELVEPGIQVVHRWRPDGTDPDGLTDAQISLYGAVARIP